MRETKATTLLNQYLRATRHYCYYEVKVARGNTLLFSKIEVNQDEGLPALNKEGLVWKLSDEDSRKKPCDGFCAPPAPAYLAVKWDQTFHLILYEKIINLRATGAKSMTREASAVMASKVIHIGS